MPASRMQGGCRNDPGCYRGPYCVAAGPGEIILVHARSNPDDHTTFDADTLPQVISGLRAQGYSFVTLDALTG